MKRSYRSIVFGNISVITILMVLLLTCIGMQTAQAAALADDHAPRQAVLLGEHRAEIEERIREMAAASTKSRPIWGAVKVLSALFQDWREHSK